MCGIFGIIGRNFNTGTFRSLAIANRDRGNEALGCFSHKGKIFKSAGDPFQVLSTEEFSKFLHDSAKSSWFICGHTRLSTRGSGKNSEYAHPFQYGKYIGIHNGVVYAPTTYAVDSMYLWDELNNCDGNYQKAWEDLGGNWGLAWTDGAFVYLQSHNQTLTICKDDRNVFYFSSDGDHLRAATGIREIHRIDEGETLKFLPNGSVENLEKLVAKKSWYSNGYQSTGCYRGSSYGIDDNDDYELITNERLIGYFDKDLQQMVYQPRADYYRNRYKHQVTTPSNPTTTVRQPLSDEDINRHCEEWETYAGFDDVEDTELEIEDCTGLIVVEGSNDPS